MNGAKRHLAFAGDSKESGRKACSVIPNCTPAFYFKKLDLLLEKFNPKVRGVDFFCILILVLCSLKYTYSIENFCDISSQDESYYLAIGTQYQQRPTEGILSLVLEARGKIYPSWYAFLYHFADTPINLFFLNYKVLSVLVTLLVYIFLRSLKVTPNTAIITAFYYLISFANLYPTPKCIHFILLFILIALTFSNIFNFKNSKLFFGSLSVLIASYASRKEYFYPYMFFIIIIFINNFKLAFNLNKKNIYQLLQPLIIIIFSILLYCFNGFPLSKLGSEGFFAFSEHFSYNWVSWTKSNLNPWQDYEYIINSIFPTAKSIYDALKVNLPLFSNHIIYNFKNLIFNIYFLTFFHHNILLPAADKLMTVAESFPGVLLFIIAIWKTKKNILRINKLNIEPIVVYCAIMAMSIVSSIMIYPRYHFIVPLSLAIIIFVGFTVDKFIVLRIKPYYLALILLLITPTVQASYYFGVPLWQEGSEPREFINTVKAIQQLPLSAKNEYVVLDSKGGIPYYLGKQFKSISSWEKNSSFDQFIFEKKLDIIVCDQNLTTKRYVDDPVFLEFLNNPIRFNFMPYKEIGTTKIFIRKGLLRRKSEE